MVAVSGRVRVSRTLSALANRRIVLSSNIKHINVLLEEKRPSNSNSAVKYFLYEYIPALKYHNPSVTYAITKGQEAGIDVVRENAGSVRIPAEGVTCEQLIRDLCSQTGSADERTPEAVRPAWLPKNLYRKSSNLSS